MKNVLRTLTITGGLAASLLIGAGATSAAENDSILNLNDGLIENLNIFESNDNNNLEVNTQNDAETDVNVESTDESLTSNADANTEGSVLANVEGEDESATETLVATLE